MKKTVVSIAIAALLFGHSGCSSSTEKTGADGKKSNSTDGGSGAKHDSKRPAEGSGD